MPIIEAIGSQQFGPIKGRRAGMSRIFHVGKYAGPITGMSCLTHYRRLWNAQPIIAFPDGEMDEDGTDVNKPWTWCAGCAKQYGRKQGHEYVVQKPDRWVEGIPFEVLDLTFGDGSLVVYRSPELSRCYEWIEGKR